MQTAVNRQITFNRKAVFMRLDKYLKVSRIIKRRTVANEACDAGKAARASYDVKVGDVIKLTLGDNERSFRVEEISEHALKEDASKMYKIL
jgi:ribosomal 50S subunit-recycling heat shock protein